MENIRYLFKNATSLYNKSQPHYEACVFLIQAAHAKLRETSTYVPYGQFTGTPRVEYSVFETGHSRSRPVRSDIYIWDSQQLSNDINRLSDILVSRYSDRTGWDSELANRVVYTAVMSVACCYDLWQRGSRKTPGTFFEVFMAALLMKMLPSLRFTKHIPLAGLLNDPEASEGLPYAPETIEEDEEIGGAASVSTDIVVQHPAHSGGVVVPLKITTRERIVQPFAHQRILDSAFGPGVYRSLLVCISETQLDERTQSVKQICVPGTVKLFQRHLSKISGLYYCDIPQRYFSPDIQRIIPVKTIGDFFIDIRDIFSSYREF